jgi:hypothetical protein
LVEIVVSGVGELFPLVMTREPVTTISSTCAPVLPLLAGRPFRSSETDGSDRRTTGRLRALTVLCGARDFGVRLHRQTDAGCRQQRDLQLSDGTVTHFRPLCDASFVVRVL